MRRIPALLILKTMKILSREIAFVELTTYEEDIETCLWYYLFCVEAKMNAEFISFERIPCNY